MAPKKKSRISSTTSPAPPPVRSSGPTVAVEIERPRPRKDETSVPVPTQQQQQQQQQQEPDEEDAEAALAAQIAADPWTDFEEIGLFKGLIRFKPTGIHKHFHLLSLHQHLVTNGYIHPRANHTRIPGIWTKLRQLYDLDALDERENAHAAPWSPTPSDDEEDAADKPDELGDDAGGDFDHHETEFELPDQDFGDLIWRARFPAETSDQERLESPPAQPELVPRPDSPPVRFVPSFEIAAEETQQTLSGAARGRGASKTKPVSNKSKSKSQAAAVRRSSRVADSVDPDDEDPAADDNDNNESQDSDEQQSERASTVDGTPAPRNSKAKAGGNKRSRPPPPPPPKSSRSSKRRR